MWTIIAENRKQSFDLTFKMTGETYEVSFPPSPNFIEVAEKYMCKKVRP